MWKKLLLVDVNPMTAFERSLKKERDRYLQESGRTLGVTKIIFKKKKVINRGN